MGLGLEDVVAGSEETLLISLDFSMGPSANYVTNRRSTTWYPSGASTFSATGVRVARVVLSGEGWLDPSTLRIALKIKNNHAANPLQPLTGPWGFINRATMLLNGTVCEDVFYANRVSEMMYRFMPTDYLVNEATEGFGTPTRQIAAGQSYTVFLKPVFFGLLRSDKMLPIRYCPVQLQMYIADTAECISEGANRSSNWEISQIEVKADILTLDSSLDQSYANMLLQSKALTIPIATLTAQYQSVIPPTLGVPISRAISRLKGVFVSFGTAATGMSPVVFPHPNQLGSDEYAAGRARDLSLNFQMSIGSKLFPERAISSAAEFYEHLRKTVALHDTSIKSMSITNVQFMEDAFIVGINTERVLGGGFSGYNCRQGDQIRIEMRNVSLAAERGAGAEASVVDRMWVTLVSDSVIEIRESGVSLYE
jgi:hypothetical protein